MAEHTADLDTLIPVFVNHADQCLIEAQAAIVEGNIDRAKSLQALAETWVSLLRAATGVPDEDC